MAEFGFFQLLRRNFWKGAFQSKAEKGPGGPHGGGEGKERKERERGERERGGSSPRYLLTDLLDVFSFFIFKREKSSILDDSFLNFLQEKTVEAEMFNNTSFSDVSVQFGNI